MSIDDAARERIRRAKPPASTVWDAGFEAALSGQQREENPHLEGADGPQWDDGWLFAGAEIIRDQSARGDGEE